MPRPRKTIDLRDNFVGGRLCLDFINTVNRDADGAPLEDLLVSAADVHRWLQAAGFVGLARGDDRIDLSMLRQFREILWHAVECGHVTPELAAFVNRTSHINAAPPLQATPDTGTLFEGADPQSLLIQAVVWSALELFASGRIARVKACPGHECGWLFLDESPAGRRRWCSMALCGNRQKALKHYRQQKQQR